MSIWLLKQYPDMVRIELTKLSVEKNCSLIFGQHHFYLIRAVLGMCDTFSDDKKMSNICSSLDRQLGLVSIFIALHD